MRNLKKLTALGAFFVVLAVVIAGCGSSSTAIPTAAVAKVSGNVISTRAWTHWMYVGAKDQAAEETGEPVIVPKDPPAFTSCVAFIRKTVASQKATKSATLKSDCKEIFTDLNNEVLTFLIEGYWYQADAHKLGISLPEKAIEAEYAKDKKQEFPTAAALKSYLSESGETEADLHWQVRVNLAYQKLVKHFEPKVTKASIAAYYKQNLTADFTVAATRDIRLVRTTSVAKAQAAYAALKGGASWQTVVNKYSVGSPKANGGLVSNVSTKTSQYENALNKVIFAAPKGKIQSPIKGVLGDYVVEVVSGTPATVKSLASETATIKKDLTTKNTTAAETKVTALSKKNWGATTLCRSAYSVADCHGYVAPKTTTTATTTPETTSTTAPTVTAPTSSTTSTKTTS